jgi:hypothetical protein
MEHQRYCFTFREIHATGGTRIHLVISGEAGDEWYLEREQERWILGKSSTSPAETTVVLDEEHAWRLFTKGIGKDEHFGVPASMEMRCWHEKFLILSQSSHDDIQVFYLRLHALFHVDGERHAHDVLRAQCALFAHRYAVEVQLSDPGSLGSKAPDTRI